MHPTILCSIKAEPMIRRILSATQIERWTLQGHETDGGLNTDEVRLTSFYGRTKDGGGFAVTLTSYISVEPKPLPGDEDTIDIRFNFSRGGSIVSSIEFSYGLDSGCWFVVHESTEFLVEGMEDPATGLAEQLGIQLNNEGVDHVHEDHALEQIAFAAEYAFANCDEPSAVATA